MSIPILVYDSTLTTHEILSGARAIVRRMPQEAVEKEYLRMLIATKDWADKNIAGMTAAGVAIDPVDAARLLIHWFVTVGMELNLRSERRRELELITGGAMNEQAVFRIIRLLADNCFDGHFTVMKFTTNWRVSFGDQPTSREEIGQMPSGDSLLTAFVKAVESADWPENGGKRTIKAV